MSSLERHYSAKDIEMRILTGLRMAGLDPEQRLTPAQLAPLDHFHTGGLRASEELLALLQIAPDARVLDIGAGLAGAARLIADSVGCQVDCVELSADYCCGAALLNRLTGLEDRIRIHEGCARELPFEDATFDVVWMQNVGMNIADKGALYRDIARVLKRGGKYGFQEMAAGPVACSHFPLPWASEEKDSCLVSAQEMRALLLKQGLVEELLEDTSDAVLASPAASSTPAPAGQLGLSVFVDNLALKAANARRSLEEGQVRLLRGIFRKR